jgi:GlpG protein
MRLIGTCKEEKEAYAFAAFLTQKGVACSYESYTDPATQAAGYRLWVQEEDDVERAAEWWALRQANPGDPLFIPGAPPLPPSPPLTPSWKVRVALKSPRTFLAPSLTGLLLFLCVLLFLWNDTQERKIVAERGAAAVQIALTPLQQALLFDYPVAMKLFEEVTERYPVPSIEALKELPPEGKALLERAEATPYWQGLYAYWTRPAHAPSPPLFEKVREGEVWRLFTPCLLHRDFLHILFNMAWLWILGRQLECRIGKGRMAILIIAVGILSNVAQYLASGPYFLGFSGVVVGMAGFIWMRQKVAPWEGYPLQRATALFVLLFVASMFLLEVVSFVLQAAHVITLSPNIANTAHIAGGVFGMALARLSFFARVEP